MPEDGGCDHAAADSNCHRLPRFSLLARARKKTAHAADIGIPRWFIAGIAVRVIDYDRFSDCLAGMLVFRCGGRLD
jgi:hypothetical protein